MQGMKRLTLIFAAALAAFACDKEIVPSEGDFTAKNHSLRTVLDSEEIAAPDNVVTVGVGSRVWICVQYAKNGSYPKTMTSSEASASITDACSPDPSVAECSVISYGPNTYVAIDAVAEGSTAVQVEFRRLKPASRCVARRTFRVNVIPGNVHAVDLGLSVKWASCNVGAVSEEDMGRYFRWSDAEDAARTQGALWRVPTALEWEELNTDCSWEWTTRGGINGYLVTGSREGYREASIFLPAAGWHADGVPEWVGTRGALWSSTIDAGEVEVAFNELIESSRHTASGFFSLSHGCSVRAVM